MFQLFVTSVTANNSQTDQLSGLLQDKPFFFSVQHCFTITTVFYPAGTISYMEMRTKAITDEQYQIAALKHHILRSLHFNTTSKYPLHLFLTIFAAPSTKRSQDNLDIFCINETDHSVFM